MTNTTRSLILLIFSCLSFIFASAQHANSFVGIRFGSVLPMGQFASHEFGKGGYALLGKSLGGEAVWFINPKLGLGVDFSSNQFEFASGYYAEDYQQSDPAFKSVDVLSTPYKLKTYMGGAYYKVSITGKLNSTFKIMGGLMTARTPNQLYGVDTYLAGKITFWKTSAYDSKITFLTGASLEYRLYDKVSLLLQADFSYAEMAFTYITGSSRYINYMQMPVFSLQPGINIHF